MEVAWQYKDVFLLLILLFLVICSAFFAATETSTMAVNRYRLLHLAHQGNKSAQRINRLLERPDRLLGVILLAGTFSNVVAAALAAVIAIELFGEVAVVPATLGIALIELIFGEMIPKTLGAFYPERFSFAASRILSVLLKLLYPLVWILSSIANGILLLFNVQINKRTLDILTNEEIRTLVNEANGYLDIHYKRILLGVLDLSDLTVDDIKVPKDKIVGIDLEEEWGNILDLLSQTKHTRLPLYHKNLDRVSGIVHSRKAMNLLAEGKLNKYSLMTIADEVYFVPENTPLNIQLLNFRYKKRRIGLIVNSYGDVQGLITLEGILEEIVGESANSSSSSYKTVQRQYDGSYLVSGSNSIREINRRLKIRLPLQGPITLSGLIAEYLGKFPEQPVSLCIEGYRMEVIQAEENVVKWVRIWPTLPAIDHPSS